MTRKEIKENARLALGNGIFKENWMYALLVLMISAIIESVAGLAAGVGTLIVAGPLLYATAKLFLKQSRDHEKINIAGLFDGFKDDFGGTLLLALMQGIFTSLWSLLFVIPGIVKSYAYSMSFYIKADHPEYDWQQCLKESQALMKGHKWDLFVLNLSFLGWIIVGSMCAGIGLLWVYPYIEAAHAELYRSLISD